MQSSSSLARKYYLPHSTNWPIMGSIALYLIMVGVSTLLNGDSFSSPLIGVGATILFIMLFGWFGIVISESLAKSYNDQVDMSFRLGMAWFILSEIMFFATFFGALFYARTLSLPWLGGEEHGAITNYYLWPNFEAIWPSMGNGPEHLGGKFGVIPAWGIPALNTIILLSSGVTVTWAHHGLKTGNRSVLKVGLGLSVLLGVLFLTFQVHEFYYAYTTLNLHLTSGVYGSTFFMLTGFHGLHVTLGVLMLFVILLRSIRGHFSPESHFAFEAVAWYWHFVDVVWLGLFIFVYWI